jgi:hypothetical protein
MLVPLGEAAWSAKPRRPDSFALLPIDEVLAPASQILDMSLAGAGPSWLLCNRLLWRLEGNDIFAAGLILYKMIPPCATQRSDPSYRHRVDPQRAAASYAPRVAVADQPRPRKDPDKRRQFARPNTHRYRAQLDRAV